jgi:two-component system response regulator RpaA
MATEPLQSGVYTTGQASRICRAAPRTVSKWCDSGMLKSYRLPMSRDRRILRGDLLKFLVAHGMPTDLMGELTEEERARVEPPAIAS